VLCEESYRVVAPRGHDLLAEYADRVPMAALDGLPMVDNDFHDNTCGRILSEACRAAGFSPRFVARSEDHHTALAFVAAGVGVTVLPELAVPEAMAGIDHRELDNPAPRRRIVAQIRDGAQSAPPVARAIELLTEAVADTVRRRGGR
jgi:DNA-binding transcriptional LysR family regulator